MSEDELVEMVRLMVTTMTPVDHAAIVCAPEGFTRAELHDFQMGMNKAVDCGYWPHPILVVPHGCTVSPLVRSDE